MLLSSFNFHRFFFAVLVSLVSDSVFFLFCAKVLGGLKCCHSIGENLLELMGSLRFEAVQPSAS